MAPLVTALMAMLLLALPAAAVPPPPEQIAANCDSPTYASDLLVCGDASLRGLDAQMRQTWTAVDFAGVVAPRAWVEAQTDWFRRRSLCAFSERHAECLREAYIERFAVVEALRLVASRPTRRGSVAVCRDAPWGATVVHLHGPGAEALTIEDGDAHVLAAATPLRPVETWRPYVGFRAQGDLVRLEPMNGPVVLCTPFVQR